MNLNPSTYLRDHIAPYVRQHKAPRNQISLTAIEYEKAMQGKGMMTSDEIALLVNKTRVTVNAMLRDNLLPKGLVTRQTTKVNHNKVKQYGWTWAEKEKHHENLRSHD